MGTARHNRLILLVPGPGTRNSVQLIIKHFSESVLMYTDGTEVEAVTLRLSLKRGCKYRSPENGFPGVAVVTDLTYYVIDALVSLPLQLHP